MAPTVLAVCALFGLVLAAHLPTNYTDCCECPISTTCADIRLSCRNEGEIESAKVYTECAAQTDCQAATQLRPWALPPSKHCLCLPQYTGNQCQLKAQPWCDDNQLDFHGTVVDYEKDHSIECSVPPGPATDYLGLLSHRVDILVKNTTVQLDLYSRPGNNKCAPVARWMHCELSNCTVKALQAGPARYTCAKRTCGHCASTDTASCDVAADLVGRMATSSHPSVLDFYAVNAASGTAEGEFSVKSLISVSLPLSCRIGGCRQRAPGPARVVDPLTLSSATALVAVPMALAIVAVCVCGAVLICALRRGAGTKPNRQSSRAAFLDKYMVDERSHDEQETGVEMDQLAQSANDNVAVGHATSLPPARRGSTVQSSYGICFSGVSVSVPSRDKPILNGVSGIIEAGQFVALIGASGSGKTTLLDVLSGWRVPSSGSVSLLNGSSVVKGVQVADVASYVSQEDILVPTQTVFEALAFSVRLRYRRLLSGSEVKDRVERVIRLLCLQGVSHSRIGTPETGGLSGGERKRVSIGLDLVIDSGLMILDEPCSGLDSFSAGVVLGVLRTVAKQRCPVLLTIHQVSASLFEDFDQVIVLTRTGHLAYFGPPPKQVPSYMDLQHLHALSENPAELLLELVADPSDKRVADIASGFEASVHHTVMMDKIEQRREEAQTVGGATHMRGAPRACPRQCAALSCRQLTDVARDTTLLLSHLVVTACMAGFLGIVFYQVDNRIPGMQNRMGFLFFSTIYFSLTAISCTGAFVKQRQLFRREITAKYYGVTAYYASVFCCDMLPLRVVPPLLFCSISYWLVGLQDKADRFLVFVLLMVLTHTTAAALCLAVSAGAASVSQANLISVLLLAFSMTFGGLFLNNETPGVMTSLRKGSFMHYAFQGLAGNEFRGLDLVFNPKDAGEFAIDGDVLLTNYGMDSSRLGADVIAVVCFFAGFCLAGFVLVCWASRKRR